MGERNERKNHARKDRVRQAEAEHDTARHRNSTRKGVGHREANFACIASVDHFTTFTMVALLGGVELTIVGAPSSDIWTALWTAYPWVVLQRNPTLGREYQRMSLETLTF